MLVLSDSEDEEVKILGEKQSLSFVSQAVQVGDENCSTPVANLADAQLNPAKVRFATFTLCSPKKGKLTKEKFSSFDKEEKLSKLSQKISATEERKRKNESIHLASKFCLLCSKRAIKVDLRTHIAGHFNYRSTT